MVVSELYFMNVEWERADFYQSTYEVLQFLIDRMPKGGIAVIDDATPVSTSVLDSAAAAGQKAFRCGSICVLRAAQIEKQSLAKQLHKLKSQRKH